jgi:hypothetical protein
MGEVNQRKMRETKLGRVGTECLEGEAQKRQNEIKRRRKNRINGRTGTKRKGNNMTKSTGKELTNGEKSRHRTWEETIYDSAASSLSVLDDADRGRFA